MANQSFKFTVGDFSCFVIRDVDDWNCNILLVNTGNHRVLVDTGNGNGNGIAPPGLLRDRLRVVGIEPVMIDIVILSHADFDHIGGAVDPYGSPVFPNARYLLSRDEWNFWESKPERFSPNEVYAMDVHQLASISAIRLTQLRHRLELIDLEAEIVPGIRVLAAPGHTPGYTVIAVSSAGEQLLCIGDLFANDPTVIENRNWRSVYDYDPVQGVMTRQQLLGYAASQQTLLMAYHLPFPGLGSVVQSGAGWRWKSLEVFEEAKAEKRT